MKRFPSIKKNSDFQNIYRNGKSYANRLLVMYVMRNGEESNQLGISVSKKVGNSVVRSRVKRLMRESYRLMAGQVQPRTLLVFIARPSMAGSSFAQVQASMKKLMVRSGCLREQTDENASDCDDSRL